VAARKDASIRLICPAVAAPNDAVTVSFFPLPQENPTMSNPTPAIDADNVAAPTAIPLQPPLERRKGREHALRFTEEGVRHLANKLRILREAGQIAYKEFISACKIKNQAYQSEPAQFFKHLSSFVRCGNIGSGKVFVDYHHDLFDEQDYRRIINTLFDQRLWYPERLFEPPTSIAPSRNPDLRPPRLLHALLPDSTFHAVARFIGMDRESNGLAHTRDTNELRAHFAGEYNVYRFSTIDLGNLLVGKLSVAWDPDTHAIVTDEDYRIGTPSRTFHLDGFLFGYDRRFRLLSRHTRSRQPQVIFIDNLDRADNEQVQNMSGIAADIQDNGRLYVTRVVFSRIGGAIRPEVIRTAPLQEAPLYAQVRLVQKPNPLGEHILEF
jgi:hypothetical protein